MPEMIDNYHGALIDPFDAERVRAEADRIVRLIKTGAEVVTSEFCPGNGSRYYTILTRIPEGSEHGGAWLVSLIDYAGCYPFYLGYSEAGYVQSKLFSRVGGIADAVPMAMLLTEVGKALSGAAV